MIDAFTTSIASPLQMCNSDVCFLFWPTDTDTGLEDNSPDGDRGPISSGGRGLGRNAEGLDDAEDVADDDSIASCFSHAKKSITVVSFNFLFLFLED
jgi:hypothetical protein